MDLTGTYISIWDVGWSRDYSYRVFMDSKTESRRVQVVYYLSRGGLLEHPHLLDLTLSSSQPLTLKDVKKRMMAVRGSGMPLSFSWSYKRSYKNGYVWQDIGDGDFIFPAHGCEYVLKGSDIVVTAADSLLVPDSGDRTVALSRDARQTAARIKFADSDSPFSDLESRLSSACNLSTDGYGSGEPTTKPTEEKQCITIAETFTQAEKNPLALTSQRSSDQDTGYGQRPVIHSDLGCSARSKSWYASYKSSYLKLGSKQADASAMPDVRCLKPAATARLANVAAVPDADCLKSGTLKPVADVAATSDVGFVVQEVIQIECPPGSSSSEVSHELADESSEPESSSDATCLSENLKCVDHSKIKDDRMMRAGRKEEAMEVVQIRWGNCGRKLRAEVEPLKLHMKKGGCWGDANNGQ